MKNMEVGRMANQRVNGNTFCERCKVTHLHSLQGRGKGREPHVLIVGPQGRREMCLRSQAGLVYRSAVKPVDENREIY
jgi:hypothetical protein